MKESTKIKKLIKSGKLKIKDNLISWYFKPPKEEQHDEDSLIDTFFENYETLKEKEYKLRNCWYDNKSCGFDIIL